ncbi:FG-GAP repeat protein [Maioricimonas rarisocia]|uniref:FG-GAP repeat protein n=1 Tax=Maioricimonas rarisocia TaxID=2528026 RepID=A0A517Z4L2_9PLAN|nr:CRTAC1 family protein [Maioricimonas rarisocia]QDU37377.1 FG-GAP repeat protein [Maioricimonas rarisocia]
MSHVLLCRTGRAAARRGLVVLLLVVPVVHGCGPDGSSDLPDGSGAAAAVRSTDGADRPASKPRGGLFADLDLDDNEKQETAAAGSRLAFSDVHSEAGIEFVYDNGASPRKLMPESTSGGAAWIDYDQDGWPDLFFPQGGSFEATSWDDQPKDELFRNLGDGRFASVAQACRLVDVEFGHGVAVADFDNDGFDDVYVCNVGPDVLYLNMGDGTFIDVTEPAGIDNGRWSSSAAWGDLDRDGDLDLYVCNYVDYDPRNPLPCVDENSNPATCNPTEMAGVPNVCYFNNGDGTFVEEADARGLNADGSKSLGIVIADLNGDQVPDVYVANDTTANHLFFGQGDGTFVESAIAMGCALSGLGQYQASMGIGFGDYDRNGYPDLYLTHFTTDSNTLYQNLGAAGFTDETRQSGLHQPTLQYLAFGTVMADFDANGWQDLFVANGHIDDFRKRTGALWHMPPQMFAFDGYRWHEASSTAGAYFERPLLGRAVASCDYDRDGDLDLAVVHQNDAAGLLRNDAELGHWLQFELIGEESNRSGLGAVVTVEQGELVLTQELPGGTSYCASHEPVLFFGLGESDQPCRVTVRWPSGCVQVLSDVSTDEKMTLFESQAEPT